MESVEVEAIENFWDFEVALCFDAPSASEQDLEVLLLLKYPELAKYLEYLDKGVEHAVDGKTTKYHLAYRGSSNDISDDVDMSFLFYCGGKEMHEFLGRKIGTDEIPECELTLLLLSHLLFFPSLVIIRHWRVLFNCKSGKQDLRGTPTISQSWEYSIQARMQRKRKES